MMRLFAALFLGWILAASAAHVEGARPATPASVDSAGLSDAGLLACRHGRREASAGVCVCDPGWRGVLCNAPVRSIGHGARAM